MKRNPRLLCAIVLAVFLLASCSCSAAPTTIEMELSGNYDDTEPFIHEMLFCVADDMDTLVLNASFQMDGESGLVEIADNETGRVLWSRAWSGTVSKTNFTIPLSDLSKESECLIRFTGTKIDRVKITITSESSLFKERERPQKPV